MSRKRKIVSLILNIYLACSTVIIALCNLMAGGAADSSKHGFHGTENLIYYTVDSNILMSLCSIGIIIFLLKGKDSLPKWFHILIMTAAVSVGVTFIIVVFFLSPGQAIMGRGYFSLFTGNNLFFHLINPVLGCLVFVRLIPHRRYSVRECLFGIIPTAVYGTVYTISVVFAGVWPDIYNFTFGGHYELAPIPIITILAISFGTAVFLTRLHNRLAQ